MKQASLIKPERAGVALLLAIPLGVALAYLSSYSPPLEAIARAEVLGSASISVTATSGTVQLSVPCGDLTLINDTVSANELYARVFHCGDAVASASRSSPIRLEPGESVSFSFRSQGEGDPGTLTAAGYCAFSYVADTAETASLRYLAK